MSAQVTIPARVLVGSALAYFIFNSINVFRNRTKSKHSSRPTSLTPDQVEIIKGTIPVLEEHGYTISSVFYQTLLAEHPELNEVFNTANQASGHQARALAGALYAYALHIDNLAALGPAVELICNKHASLYISPGDYEIVGEYLLRAMKEVLGSAWTKDIHGAWKTAYWALANVLINREAALYKENSSWTTWRNFMVVRKNIESSEITSFYLKPTGKEPPPIFRPGQYISVKVDVSRLKYLQPRQYSLSDSPQSEFYRISVKKETGAGPTSGVDNPLGYVSNVLHDETDEGDIIQVSHPRGDFFLTSEQSAHPLVLLSAGVGITPMMSILNTIVASSIDRKVHFIHGSRTTKARAFQDHVQALAKQHRNIQVTLFTVQPSNEDTKGVTYHHAGRVNLEKLDPDADLYLDNKYTEYYVCGPEGFMSATSEALKARSVTSDRIKLELFGTGGVPQ
jgi:nitric oxide dioxygenase